MYNNIKCKHKRPDKDSRRSYSILFKSVSSKASGRIDDSLGVVFAKTALEGSTVENKEKLLESFKSKYPTYSINEAPLSIEDGIARSWLKALYKDCPADVQIGMMAMLMLDKRGNFDKKSGLPIYSIPKILAHMIPQSMIVCYLCNHYSGEKLEEKLSNLGVNLKVEYQAIEDMRSNAYGPGVLNGEGETYFNLQYGNTPIDQLKHLCLEFGNLPSEINKDTKITKAFVTEDFLKLWKAIEWENVETCRKFSCKDKSALSRVPNIIGNLKKLESLSLSDNQFESLPPEIGQLENLESLYLDNAQLESLSQTIINLDKLNIFKENDIDNSMKNRVHFEENVDKHFRRKRTF